MNKQDLKEMLEWLHTRRKTCYHARESAIQKENIPDIVNQGAKAWAFQSVIDYINNIPFKKKQATPPCPAQPSSST